MGKTVMGRSGGLIHFVDKEEVDDMKLADTLEVGQTTPSGRFTVTDYGILENFSEDWDEINDEEQKKYVIKEAIKYIPSRDLRRYYNDKLPFWTWQQCLTVCFHCAWSKKEIKSYMKYMLDTNFIVKDNGAARSVVKKIFYKMKHNHKVNRKNIIDNFNDITEPDYPARDKLKSMSFEEIHSCSTDLILEKALNIPNIYNLGDVVRDMKSGYYYIITRANDIDSKSVFKGFDHSDDFTSADVLKINYSISNDENKKLIKDYNLPEGTLCSLETRIKNGYYHVHLDPLYLEKVDDSKIPEKYRKGLEEFRCALNHMHIADLMDEYKELLDYLNYNG